VPKRLLSLLALGAAVLMLAIALPPYVREAFAAVKLQGAQRRWRERPFIEYRIQSSERKVRSDGSYEPTSCAEDYTVKGARVAEVHRDTCQWVYRPPTTVPVLFDLVDHWNGACGPNGCFCDGRHRVYATYDPESGSPRRIRTQLVEEGWQYWLGSAFRGLTNTSCTARGRDDLHIDVRVQPLPPGGIPW
jgi:hypothetical protein